MHDAFECIPVVEKLPIPIECVAAYGNTLLVGTSKGHLLLYEISPGDSPSQKFKVELKRTNRNFARRPIVQMQVIAELGIIISLSDVIVSIHDLDTFGQRMCLQKTKGATLFSVDFQVSRPFNVSPPIYQLRICVVVKRKLELFQWQDGAFEELKTDLGLPDIPKAVAWCGDCLCVGFKKEYILVKTTTGEMNDLFPTGKLQEPLITAVANSQLALGKDDMSIYVDAVSGKPTQRHATRWSEPPVCLAYSRPYLIAVLPSQVEIRTIEPHMLVQSIELPNPRCIEVGESLYVASQSNVWRLAPVPASVQIQQLKQEKHFDLALHLARMIPDGAEGVDKDACIEDIQYHYGFHLFTQRRFKESLDMFSGLKTDPIRVIALYPNLLPSELRRDVVTEFPVKPPHFVGIDLEKGLHCLTDYLMQKRREAQKQSEAGEADVTATERAEMSQIIDTTLLKCYLQTNDALIAPLLRLKDNKCHVEECERVLTKAEKHSELVLLYRSKGLHRKALELLLQRAHNKSGPLKGHESMVEYLQRLGPGNIELILEYSKWILDKHPEEGLKIFTEDMSEVEALPREKVVEFLRSISHDLAVQYLERIFSTWKDQTPAFHNQLITFYKNKVDRLWDSQYENLSAGSEPGELGEYRRKLLAFLETSKFYKAEKLITHFPQGKMFHERALLLGRLNQHEQALAIYALVLKDMELAKTYCCRTYNKDEEQSKDVYLCLFTMYLNPPDCQKLGVIVGGGMTVPTQPNVEAALQVLVEHHQHIDTPKALNALPSTTKLESVLQFLVDVVERQSVQRRRSQVLRSLFYSELLQVEQKRIRAESDYVAVGEERLCESCKKRLGTSAFARSPDGTVLHFWCFEEKMKTRSRPKRDM